MEAKLSVIIPTHKRADTLRQCLEHLSKQTIISEIEVIVVHDGEDDADTKNLMLSMSNDDNRSLKAWQGNHDIVYFSIPKSQQGVARNLGVAKAKAPLVLFIGDDIFLAPDACEKHLKAHHVFVPEHLAAEKRDTSPHTKPIAVLGFTTWDSSLQITPAMKWLEDTGWQFGYSMLSDCQHSFVPPEMQERFTYTSNISLPTAIAKQFPFRDDVTLYGWEDTLWGKQLKDAGIQLYYEPDAAAVHHHLITLDDSLQRIETLGSSLMHVTKIDPDLGRIPTGWKLLMYRLIALTPTMRGRHYRAFLKGIDKNK